MFRNSNSALRLWLMAPLVAILLLASCQQHREGEISEVKNEEKLPYSISTVGKGVPGKLIIKITEGAEPTLRADNDGAINLNQVPTAMQQALRSVRSQKLERLFPPAGVYEERTRAMGMHLWYIVSFDEEVPLHEAHQVFNALEQVQSVEVLPNIEKASTGDSSWLSSLAFSRPTTHPFNDPLLPKQWHYNNTGEETRYVAGADINLHKAWEIETGKPEVIVCVVDGGIEDSSTHRYQSDDDPHV